MAPTPFATPPNTDLVLDNTPHVAARCTLIHCSTLQHTATHCNAPRGRHGINPTCHTSCYPMSPRQHPTRCSTMNCNTQQHNALQRNATHCNTLQRTATHCNALQRTATHLEEDMASKSFDALPNNDLVLENSDVVLENPPSPSPLSYPHNLRQNHESKHSLATVNR